MTKEPMITHATLNNGIYPLTLQMIYPDFGLVAREANAEASDEKLHKCLEYSAAKMGNRMGSTVKAVMFDNAKKLVAGRMKEYCEHK